MLGQQYEVRIIKDDANAPNIAVNVKGDGEVSIILNGFKLFGTMANKDTIIVGLNEKITELIQRHLNSKAMEEEQARNGR